MFNKKKIDYDKKKVRRSSKKETFKNEEVVCKVQTF